MGLLNLINKKDKKLLNAIINTIKDHPKFSKYFDKKIKYPYKCNIKEIIYIIILKVQQGFSQRFISKLQTSINWKTINKVYNKLTGLNLLELTYVKLLEKYIIIAPTKKFKNILTDTSGIYNKLNIDSIGRNKYFKNKNILKISLITDSYGVPFNVITTKGNFNDAKILYKQLKNKKNYISNEFLNKYKVNFLADSGYDSSKIRNYLQENKFTSIIDFNNRNTKNKDKIRKFTKKEKKIYKKRITIENTFNKIKHFKELNFVYAKKVKSFIGYLFITLCSIVLFYL